MIQTKPLKFKFLILACALVILLGFCFKDAVLASYERYAYGTYNKPEDALEAVTNQLNMISKHLNKGISAVNYLNEIEHGTSIIFKVEK